jgi:hypothetical protein
MKREKLGLAILLLLFGGQAQANFNTDFSIDAEAQDAETQHALEVLTKAKIIVLDEETNKMTIRPDVIEKLRAAGKLDQVYASMGSFCM